MAHQTTPEAEALLDVWHPIYQGGIALIDYLGTDLRIVQAARVSYGKEAQARAADLKGNRGLIDYMIRDPLRQHSSPFEQVVLTFLVSCSIAVKNQIVRTRTARMNEFSGRYSEVPDVFHIPEPEDFHIPEREDFQVQDTVNRQGSGDLMGDGAALLALQAIADSYRESYADYERLLELGLARERARLVLPQGIYTKFYWQIDLSNLFRFLVLRTDHHAQKETRAIAEVMGSAAQAVAPIAYAAWCDHVRDAVAFSAHEFGFLSDLLAGRAVQCDDPRLREQFGAKLLRIGQIVGRQGRVFHVVEAT